VPSVAGPRETPRPDSRASHEMMPLLPPRLGKERQRGQRRTTSTPPSASTNLTETTLSSPPSLRQRSVGRSREI
jgi:hypothetical protein